MVFGTSLSQRSESYWWIIDGVRVENIPRIHNVWPTRTDSRIYERMTVWSKAVRRQDHLHVNVKRHCMVRKKMQRNTKVILTKLRIMLADFFAVIGHSWGLDQKRNGTELILISLMEFGTKLLRKWWLNSQIPAIRYSVLPAPLKEEMYDAKEETRRLSISTVANKTSN